MIYLICQDWSNTSNNHAGMKYLCHQLQERYPLRYKSVVIEDFYKVIPANVLLRKIHMTASMHRYKRALKKVFKYLEETLNDGDKIFLMEYMERLTPQVYLAEKLKKKQPQIPIYALVHLVPEKLEESFTQKELKKWVMAVDRIMTLGSSLTKYFEAKGIKRERLITAFHYVDVDYYKKSSPIKSKSEVKVIAMGNQMRNIDLLRAIVRHLQNVKFIICQGVNDMSRDFEGCSNVSLIPFVSEDTLKAYMDSADISLNVMKDTIGSNVIVTSMSMGLAMVCSDVGSIHDYCNYTNCMFCNSDIESFTRAITMLASDKKMLEEYKRNSMKISQSLTIERFSSQILNVIEL